MRAYYRIELDKIGARIHRAPHNEVEEKRWLEGKVLPLLDHLDVLNEIRHSLIKQFGEENVFMKEEGNSTVVYVP